MTGGWSPVRRRRPAWPRLFNTVNLIARKTPVDQRSRFVETCLDWYKEQYEYGLKVLRDAGVIQ